MDRLINPFLVDAPIPIRTTRLLIRPSREGDGKCLAEAKRESWPELGQWLAFAGDPTEVVSEAKEEAYVRKKHVDFMLRTDLWFLVFDGLGKHLIGTASYDVTDRENRTLSMSYWVRTGATGKGYATEIGNALIRYAFGALSATRVGVSHA